MQRSGTTGAGTGVGLRFSTTGTGSGVNMGLGTAGTGSGVGLGFATTGTGSGENVGSGATGAGSGVGLGFLEEEYHNLGLDGNAGLWCREGAVGVGRMGREEVEDPMRDRTVEDLRGVAVSPQHFAVLLVRKFFSREQLKGGSVNGGAGKAALDKFIIF